MSGDTLYDKYFFNAHALSSGSEASAARVVPIVNELLAPNSVLDVGCGIGGWLGQWVAAGVTDVLGVDGDYVNRDELRFPRERFVAHDLATLLDLGRRFDLVSTVEVAEHIPAASADTFVETLTRHADTVLFSAAIPGQGGTGHINEQWPSYWAAKFAHHNFDVYDVVRDALWTNPDVGIWYRQNLLIFATAEAAARAGLVRQHDRVLDVVHPELWSATAKRPLSARLKKAILDSKLGPLARATSRQLRRG